MSSENALSPASPPVRSKSRLVRMLTTKRNKDDDDNHQSRRPAATSAYSREQRQAALRARGLLPQLSLSEQERELDHTIPVVKLEPAIEEESKGPSAADLIKKQWEEMNKEKEEKQFERLESFKFGASSTKTSTLQPKELNDSRSLSSDTDEPTLKAAKAARRRGMHKASLSQQMQEEAESLKNLEPARIRTDEKALPTPPDEKRQLSTPVTPVLDLPTEFQTYINTPPSPTPPAKDLAPTSALPSGRSTASNNKSSTGRASPRNDPSEEQSLPHHKGGVDTILSPTITLVNGRHDRSDSIPRAGSGSSSIQTPSLDSSSTAKSSDSLPNAKSHKARLKSVENGIPVIVENPAERREAEEVEHVSFSVTELHSSSSHGHGTADDDERPPPLPPRDSEKGRKRGITDPPPMKTPTSDLPEAENGAPMVRRKTINPFKRNQQGGDDGKSKRNMFTRVGTVLRAKDKFATPTPLGQTGARANVSTVSPPQSPTRRPAVVRQAVNPVYYSGGDIQAQASTIKDEEERRMAELAFLS